jgi:polyribonucleotide nucleotidyltransferase
MPQSFQTEIGGRTLIIETGELAGQANGAVTVRYGDTVVLVTACMSAEPREGVDFVPLTVDYEERLYAAGKIPGGFFKREGRPSQDAVLTSRLTDRPLRPLFPYGFRNEVQVVVAVLSTDQENNPDMLSIIGASAALGISDIPFGGPIGAVRIGYIDGEFVLNPTFTQLLESKLDLVVAGTEEMVIMLEAGAREVSEDIILQAIKLGQESNQGVIKLQKELIQSCGKPKMEFEPKEPNLELQAKVSAIIRDKLPQGTYWQNRSEREANLISLRAELLEELGDSFPQEEILSGLAPGVKAQVRSSILETGVRPSGRGLTEIRPITCAVGKLPRTHGSGLFTRGETQVLTITTLGSPGEEQLIDTISREESKHFMHHYNFPPFSTGEVRRIGTPGRREIGHGALAERALLPVLPSEDDFPYTIRLVSEVLSSNGSTSMASVCAGSLSLMDAGIPIKTPVAGVAMGLVQGADSKYVLLTDIEGLEDACGDMDFKVAGTADGITALQLDLKTKGISLDIMADALSQARQARLFILERIKETISTSRPEVSKYAPKMTKITIDPDKIRYVIGPGGRMIRSIMDETKASIDVESDGTIIIGSPSEEATRKAIEIIESLTREIEVGGIYTGKVTRVADFGAFVEIMPGKEGLVRIGELADYRVANVEEVAKVGDEIMVMVIGIDNLGRINLSRRAVFQKLSQIPGARVGPKQTGTPGRGRARPTRQPFPRGER